MRYHITQIQSSKVISREWILSRLHLVDCIDSTRGFITIHIPNDSTFSMSVSEKKKKQSKQIKETSTSWFVMVLGAALQCISVGPVNSMALYVVIWMRQFPTNTSIVPFVISANIGIFLIVGMLER